VSGKGGVRLERFPLHLPLLQNNPFDPRHKPEPRTVVLRRTFTEDRSLGDKHVYHHAADIGATWGTAVVASVTGRVSQAGWHDVGGWSVTIDSRLSHSGCVVKVYHAHLLVPPSVRVGTEVVPGDLLGIVGATGNAAGPHLHFALWPESRPGADDGFSHPQDPHDQLLALSSSAGGTLRAVNDEPEYTARMQPIVAAAWVSAVTYLKQKKAGKP
jgi:murein DD-endopeptidase MepM/ murein hydrolase activator NlpD